MIPRLKRFLCSNRGIAAIAFLLLCARLPVRELIPVNNGLGYDGTRYAVWVKIFSMKKLAQGFAEDSEQANRGDRPDERQTPRTRRARRGQRPDASAAQLERQNKLARLNSYTTRRILPALVVHYAMRWTGQPTTDENIVAAFTLANILLITLAVYLLCRAADELGVGPAGKWLGFLAMVVNYANLKMPLFYPILTDSFALAIGAASLCAYLRGRQVLLLLLSLLGAFAWPSILQFGLLLLVFPRTPTQEVRPSPYRLHLWSAGVATAGLLVLIWQVVASEFSISSPIPTTAPVRPWHSMIWASAAVSALYVFFGLRALLDSGALWSSLHPARLLRQRWLVVAALSWVAVELVVGWLKVEDSPFSSERFLTDTIFTSITQPGSFFVAHVLFFGPLMLLFPFLWPAITRNVQRNGTGLVLCFVLALGISAGSESRKLMNFYPFLVLFMAQSAEQLVKSKRAWVLLALTSLVFSKVWMTMASGMWIPGFGEVDWRTLYASSRGPWIDLPWYLAQLAVIAPVAAALYFGFGRRGGLARASTG